MKRKCRRTNKAITGMHKIVTFIVSKRYRTQPKYKVGYKFDNCEVIKIVDDGDQNIFYVKEFFYFE